MSRALLKNTAWGLLGELAIRGGKIAQIILMARILGAEDIGRFNYALAIAGLFSVLFDFGVATIAVKELARRPGGSSFRLYGRVKLLSLTVGVVLVGAAALLTPMPLADRYLAFGLGLYLAFNELSTYIVVAYRSKGEFWRETAWRSVIALMQLAVCVASLFLTHRLEWVVLALVATAALGLAPLAGEWLRQPLVQEDEQGVSGILKAARECIPIAMTVLVGTVYMNFDVVVLGRYVSMEQVGWYSVAVKTIFGLLIMPLHYFLLATLPVFAAEFDGGEAASIRSRWLRGFVLSSTAGGLLVLCTALIAEQLLSLIFGASFAAGGAVLKIYAFAGFMFYLYTPLSQWLLLLGKQKWTLYIQMAAMISNILLVIICVPLWGVWGGVVAAVVTHAVIAIGHASLVLYYGGFTRHESEWHALFRVVLGLSLAIGVLQFANYGEIFSKALAIVVFGVCAHNQVLELTRYIYAKVQN